MLQCGITCSGIVKTRNVLKIWGIIHEADPKGRFARRRTRDKIFAGDEVHA
tara:strand:- start:132919 stop:133071 length:153 start_codon:yes stop_codon:yes gene_type:complete